MPRRGQRAIARCFNVDYRPATRKIPSMGLIRILFWVAVFLVSTFCFVVLFDHGPHDFQKNATTEFHQLQEMYNGKIERKKDDSDKIAH